MGISQSPLVLNSLIQNGSVAEKPHFESIRLVQILSVVKNRLRPCKKSGRDMHGLAPMLTLIFLPHFPLEHSPVSTRQKFSSSWKVSHSIHHIEWTGHPVAHNISLDSYP